MEHKASIFMPWCRCKFKGNSNQWIYRFPFVNSIWDFALMKIWTGGNIFTVTGIKKVSSGIAIPKSTRNYLPQRTLNILYRSFIDTHFSYGNIVWYIKDTSWTVLELRPKWSVWAIRWFSNRITVTAVQTLKLQTKYLTEQHHSCQYSVSLYSTLWSCFSFAFHFSVIFMFIHRILPSSILSFAEVPRKEKMYCPASMVPAHQPRPSLLWKHTVPDHFDLFGKLGTSAEESTSSR